MFRCAPAILLFAVTESSDTCNRTWLDYSWQSPLRACGIAHSSIVQSTLNSCYTGLMSTAELPYLVSSSLWTNVISVGNSCSTQCVVPYTNAISQLNNAGTYLSSCPALYSLNRFVYSSTCLSLMYDAVEAMNSCMTVDKSRDIITGIRPNRCTKEDFATFELIYHPWAPMILQKKTGTALEAYASAISTGMGTALKRQRGTLSCHWCFNSLYESMPIGSSACDEPYSDACRVLMTAHLETFAVCNGGQSLNTYEYFACSQLVAEEIYPYRAIVACAGTGLTATQFIKCLSETMGRAIELGSACQPCYDLFSSAVAAIEMSACTANPHIYNCPASFVTAMSSFSTCSGHSVSLVDIRCSSGDMENLEALSWDAIFAALHDVADANLAKDLIETDASLSNWKTALDGVTCKPCFRLLIGDLFTLFASDAGAKTACLDPYTDACKSAVTVPLDAFAYCSSQVLNWEKTSAVCSLEEFITFVAAYNPWESMLAEAKSGTSISAYAASISLDVGMALNPSSGWLACRTCFDQLYSDMPSDPSACDLPFSNECRTFMSDALTMFTTCTGGQSIYTYGTFSCSQWHNEEFYPYRGIVVCSGLNLDSGGFAACLSAHLSRSLVIGTDCQPCYDALSIALGSIDKSACNADPHHSACTTLLSTALRNFETCSGATVEQTDVQCSEHQWAGLEYASRSWVPIYVASKYAANYADARVLFGTDVNLEPFRAEISGLTCEPCFSLLAADFYTTFANDSSVLEACADPYSDACRDALTIPLGAFTYCSGRQLNWSAASTTCTSSEFDNLVAVGVSNKFVAAAETSTSQPEYLAALAAIKSDIDRAKLEVPCWTCFTEFGRSLFNLNEADLATCADMTSNACKLLMDTHLNSFEECSGYKFVLKYDEITTTVMPAVSVVSTTTTTTSDVSSSVPVISDTPLGITKNADQVYILVIAIYMMF